MYPLHYACSKQMSSSIIFHLCGLNSAVCKEPDVKGRLPLHQACNNQDTSLDLVICLLEHFPDGCSMVDGSGNDPLDYTCGHDII